MKPLAQRALVLAALLATLAGCYADTKSFAPHREIEVIGVVTSQKMAGVEAGVEYTWTFDDGRTYTLTYAGFGADVPVGDLLIAGSKPSAWYLVGYPQGPSSGQLAGCYLATGYTIEEHDTTVDLDDGVTLQKAPDYQPNGLSPGQRLLAALCLDREGRVRGIYVEGA